MKPTSIDMITWALLLLLMADHASGALGGLYIVLAVALIVLAYVVGRQENRSTNTQGDT